jgi:hypothetical protein
MRPSSTGLFCLAILMIAGCTVKLVAPYDSDLQQKASAMQAEVASWELTMRAGAGTITDDPRNPSVAAVLNKWQGEAEAMLTLAISNDPGAVGCGPAVEAVSGAIIGMLPADLRAGATASKPSAALSSGCEAQVVASLAKLLADLGGEVAFCRVPWVPDSYFAALGQNAATAPKLPAPPDAATHDKLRRACVFEFTPPAAVVGGATPLHGPAVSRLVGTLGAIVYVENRKKAAAAQ